MKKILVTDLNTIYILKNKCNNKIYIGQTWHSIKDRFDNGHGYKTCTYLHNAIQKYGKDNFYYEILTFCLTQESADYIENYFIEKFKSTDPSIGYNIRSGGSRGKNSEESKIKIGNAHRGKIISQEIRDKMSIANIGKNHSEETKRKMSETSKLKRVNVGKKASQETKDKLSKIKIGNKSNTGKNLSRETKNKIAKFSKGRTWIVVDNKRVWVDK